MTPEEFREKMRAQLALTPNQRNTQLIRELMNVNLEFKKRVKLKLSLIQGGLTAADPVVESSRSHLTLVQGGRSKVNKNG